MPSTSPLLQGQLALFDVKPEWPRQCRTPELHADDPDGYLARFEWAQKMMQTHDQIECPGCGLWAQWVLKEPQPA